MLAIFSIIYGPLVVFLMDNFSEKISSLVILAISVALIVLNKKEKSPAWIIPFVYFVISLSTLCFGKSVLLKFCPLLISIGVATLLSMKDKVHFMIRGAISRWKFLYKNDMTTERLCSDVWIWSMAAWFNVFFHIIFLIFASKWFWAFYVSVGWYAVFILALFIHIFIWKVRKKRGKIA